MTDDSSFSVKEVMIDIKTDLKSFREQYDKDQERRDEQIAKRPTRAELYAAVSAAGVLVGITMSLVGG